MALPLLARQLCIQSMAGSCGPACLMSDSSRAGSNIGPHLPRFLPWDCGRAPTHTKCHNRTHAPLQKAPLFTASVSTVTTPRRLLESAAVGAADHVPGG